MWSSSLELIRITYRVFFLSLAILSSVTIASFSTFLNSSASFIISFSVSVPAYSISSSPTVCSATNLLFLHAALPFYYYRHVLSFRWFLIFICGHVFHYLRFLSLHLSRFLGFDYTTFYFYYHQSTRLHLLVSRYFLSFGWSLAFRYGGHF